MFYTFIQNIYLNRIQIQVEWTTRLCDPNWRTQWLKLVKKQASTILQMSTCFYFIFNANNSVYTCHRKMVDPLKAKDIRFLYHSNVRYIQICAPPTAQISVLHKFQYD